MIASLVIFAVVCFQATLSAVVPTLQENRIEDEDNSRSIGGIDASPGQFPWVVALHLQNGAYLCAASIIGKTSVLTAGHCAHIGKTLLDPSQIYGIANHNRTASSVRLEFQRIAVYPNYNINDVGGEGDIAVFRTTSPIPTNDLVQSVCLPATSSMPNNGYDNGLAMGWGRGIENKYPAILKYNKVELSDTCESPNKICTKNNPQFRLCRGDSGGPLIQRKGDKYVQIGVFSYIQGHGPCDPGFGSDGYTRVSSFTSFIKEHTSEDNVCFMDDA